MTAGGYVVIAYVAGLLVLWGYGIHLIRTARVQMRRDPERHGGKSCQSS